MRYLVVVTLVLQSISKIDQLLITRVTVDIAASSRLALSLVTMPMIIKLRNHGLPDVAEESVYFSCLSSPLASLRSHS